MSKKARQKLNVLLLILIALGVATASPAETDSADPPTLKLAASMYVGWMPWYLAAEDGTLEKEAEKAGLVIQFVADDYLETIQRFIEGKVHAVAITNIDALGFVAGAGIASDVILISSYSHGNDAILLRPEAEGDVTKGPIGLVEYSVSHYLLDRYLERENLPHDAVQRRDISEIEMVGHFQRENSDLLGVVTWNPMVSRLENRFNVHNLFDSRFIEGEIADMLLVRRDALAEYPAFSDALLGAWFNVMSRMRGPQKHETVKALSELSGTSPEDYERQLTTTLLIKTPEVGLGYLWDKSLRGVMVNVEAFVSQHMFVPNPPQKPWVSYAGEQPALLHFNDRPLQAFLDGQ